MKGKNNNKGFTMVEILAVVTILGILSTLAIGAYSRYKTKAKIMDYDAIAKSAYSAYETYCLMNKKTTGSTVSLQTLFDEQLIDNIQDPGDKSYTCKGNVVSSGNLSSSTSFTVYLCCGSYNYQYVFGSSESKTELTDKTKCN